MKGCKEGSLAVYVVLCVLFAGPVLPLALGVTRVQAIKVGSIDVVGNRLLTKEQIRAKVRTRVDEVFDEQTAREDRNRIAELAGVAWVTYQTKLEDNKITLTFVIGEKSIVREIVFTGNRKYKAKTLQQELDFVRGDFLDVYLAQAGEDAVAEFYRNKGFAFVKVGLDEEQLGYGKVVYAIDEGPRVKVDAVMFAGNEAIRSRKLEKAIKTRTRRWFFWPVFYDEQKVRDDVDRLVELYQKRSYLGVRVAEAVEFSADKRRAYIAFTISEGPIYTIEQIALRDNVHFDDETLLGQLKEKQGRPYNQARADVDAERIRARYREAGFIDVKVVQRRSLIGPGRVRSEFDIVEGERFRIGRVNITGNLQTQDKVVRRVLDEYDFKPGEWYNANVARGTGEGSLERAIRGAGMMESATITPTGELAGQRDAQVSVTEGKSGMIWLGAGVSTDIGLVGQLIFEQRNFDIEDWPESWSEFITGDAFKGAGQRLRISLEPGVELSQYSVSFTEPYLNDRPISLDVAGLRYLRIRESYDEVRTRGSVGLEKRYKQGWRRGVSLRIENVDVDDIELDAPKEITSDSGNNLLAGVRLYIAKRLTGGVFNPTKGYEFNAGYEQVSGDHTFGVLDGTYRRYKTIYEDLAGRKTVLATKLRAATIVGDAPAFERFYAGGIGSIRGFDYRGVSPRSGPSNDPIGSDWIFLANAEATVPLMSETISWLLFVDSGAVDSGGYRVAVGTGIQILVPQWFGPVPMRFALASPVMKDDDDETQVFSFWVGRLF